MSLAPGLLASTSRACLVNSAARTHAPAVWAQARANSTAAKAATAKKGGTVQASDEETANRERMLRRMPPGLDLESAYGSTLFEPIVDPPIKLSWALNRNGRSYLLNRVQRYQQTRLSAQSMLDQGIAWLPENRSLWAKAKSWVWKGIYLKGLIEHDLTPVYSTYNRAQATGDSALLRSSAHGMALERASKVVANMSRHRSSGQWKLVRHITPPKLISARTGPIDPYGRILTDQVAVQFDTEQALTTKGVTKNARVIENIVFDRRQGVGSPWRIISKLDVTTPPFLLQDAKKDE